MCVPPHISSHEEWLSVGWQQVTFLKGEVNLKLYEPVVNLITVSVEEIELGNTDSSPVIGIVLMVANTQCAMGVHS